MELRTVRGGRCSVSSVMNGVLKSEQNYLFNNNYYFYYYICVRSMEYNLSWEVNYVSVSCTFFHGTQVHLSQAYVTGLTLDREESNP